MSDRSHAVAQPATPQKSAPARGLTPLRALTLQRKCACGGSGSSCHCDDDKLHREPSLRGSPTPTAVPSVVNAVLASPGRPLPLATRSYMESRFGHDFGGVRVHDDASAAESARAVRARAYTVGQHIAFDSGQYAPQTHAGRHLLAHELAHTVQQGGLRRAPASGALSIAPETDVSEREATAAADAVVRGARPRVAGRSSSLALARAPWGTCPPGERPSAVPEKVNLMAELAILTYYEGQAKQKQFIVSNRKPLESFFPKPPPKHRAMLTGMYESDTFRSDRPGYISRTEVVAGEEAEGVPAPEPEITEEGEPVGGSALTAVSGLPRSALEPEHQLLRPDVIDLEDREVYDVTTIRQADAKVAKVQNYVDRLEAIRQSHRIPGKAWQPGTRLKRPPPRSLLYQEQGHPAICFALTDFTLRPGVLVYEPIQVAEGAAVGVTEPYEIATKAGKKATIDANFAPSATDLLNTGANNMAAARIIRGLVLKTLRRGRTPAQDRITACVLSEGCVEMAGKPAIPITITSGNGEIELRVHPQTRVISLARSYKGYKFRSKHLSEGTLTSFDIDSEEEGARGVGKLRPSLSLLRGLELGIEFSEDRYAITAGLDEDSLKKVLKPLPAVKMTKAQLELELFPEFRPQGVLEMELHAGNRKLLDAGATVGPGASGGLRAEGWLKAYIPGVDSADGKVLYENGRWTAFAELQSTQMDLPYVTGGTVRAGFDEKGPYGSGHVDLEIPGGHTARVALNYRDRLWFFSGRGDFHIKRIGTRVGLIIDYFDGRVLRGSGTVKGFNFKGLSGDITVNYEGRVGAPRPRVWGAGKFDIKKGKVKGGLNVRLLETGKFAGEGAIVYEIRQGLVATAGIAIDENEKVKLTGTLNFPPYVLFEAFPKPPKNRVDIFSFGPKRVGVPYLSFGPVGLQAGIRAGVFATYSIGPGLITGGFIKTVIDNPLEENPDVSLELGGRISIVAKLSVTGYVGGSLVLDLLVAEAGGEMTISVTATLSGEAGSNFFARYSKGVFEAGADLDVLLKFLLTLCFTAHAWAAAGVWKFKVTTGKSWQLASFTYDPGLQLGLKLLKPITYSSERGFDADGVLQNIQWIKPTLDPEHALRNAFGKTGGSESEGKPKPQPCPDVRPY